MDTKHFKMDFSIKKYIIFVFTSFTPLLSIVSKLYKTYYLLRLLMIVCIVLIWFLLPFLQESGNLDVILKVRRKIKNKISKLVLVKSQLKKKI